ncbi:L-serine ammonia-lyase [Kordiimonas gwangyangensis]|uniref:L-serine ammonia-lyase n=1 Tax=Kordiimonas gwangyangensis TaxID=288022 RepID=UPI0003661421|nr:L-serine ammonia-lyase [Kordiimonas gwangyangensis]
MSTSVLDLFNIGIGPSSSHTVGPMKAAREFVEKLEEDGLLDKTDRLVTKLYGSLGATGRGHGSDGAVILGLLGECPREVDVENIPNIIQHARENKTLNLMGKKPVVFEEDTDLQLLPREQLPFHPNGMEFWAYDADGNELSRAIYYSIGGGFIVHEKEAKKDKFIEEKVKVPYPFKSGAELLDHCAKTGKSISAIMMANEKTMRSVNQIRAELLEIWHVMEECVERGCSRGGQMPGLNIKRRAKALYEQLSKRPESALTDPLTILDWVNLYALAVNEENAVGGRVVTAPTNGAAGIVPAVLHYYMRFIPGANEDGVVRFLLTAGAVGMLFKENASISGAEVGCQGEVGSACSMAAAGLTEVLGGTPEQVENAAEIGMEHNLGLTCDPIGGLVQVPCIERNAMASIKAINAARLALRGDGKHFVSLDKVIRTMRLTGRDMRSKYKETARGGLAVTVPIAATVVDC